MVMRKPLEGRVVAVTGAGRERGIGWAAARELARWGAYVIVTDLGRPNPRYQWEGRTTVAENTTGLEELVAEIRREGGEASEAAVDVTSLREVEACVAEILDRHGRLDAVFNNAGTPVGIVPFLETDQAVWELSWQTNVMGVVNWCRASIPAMSSGSGGSIINNSSVAGLRATLDCAAYTTTKYAVIGLTKSLAVEFGRAGIRCNAVCPGDIQTQMNELVTEVMEERSAGSATVSGSYVEPIALGRRGEPEDVARVVAWLASDLAAYVTGETIRIDGGWEVGL
jgi:3-oxoacyl-[acyl-carrier protein] reductase